MSIVPTAAGKPRFLWSLRGARAWLAMAVAAPQSSTAERPRFLESRILPLQEVVPSPRATYRDAVPGANPAGTRVPQIFMVWRESRFIGPQASHTLARGWRYKPFVP